jgi:transketolase
MRKFLVETLLNHGQEISPFFITGDLGYSVLEPLQDEYGDKFLNLGILEQSMMSIAGGIAKNGNKVFVYSITNFATFRALEQVRLDVSYQDLSVCIVGVGTGFQYQTAGYSHWGIEDLAVISAIENVRIFSPADKNGVEFAVKTFLKDGRPTYLRLGKATAGSENNQNVESRTENFSELGNGNNLIFCHGVISWNLANHPLFNEKIHKIIIVNEITASDAIFRQVFNDKTQSISVLEEVVFTGSLGSRISRILSTSGLGLPFSWIGIDPSRIPSFAGDENFLRNYFFGEHYLDNIFNPF